LHARDGIAKNPTSIRLIAVSTAHHVSGLASMATSLFLGAVVMPGFEVGKTPSAANGVVKAGFPAAFNTLVVSFVRALARQAARDAFCASARADPANVSSGALVRQAVREAGSRETQTSTSIQAPADV
jgi:hypothetical protein